MGHEPDFIAQNGEPMTRDERLDWIRARINDAGAPRLVRASVHPDMPNLTLVEAWNEPPPNYEQGEPRWQLTVAS